MGHVNTSSVIPRSVKNSIITSSELNKIFMLDDQRKRIREDEETISIHQTQEINYWTKQLKSDPDKLKKAVAAVGPIVKDVRKWLSIN